MGILRTNNHYRRWLNLVPALLIPGAAQMLAGKTRRGGLALLMVLTAAGLLRVLKFHPATSFDYYRVEAIDYALIILALLVLVDGLRWSIPCRGAKPWAVVFAGLALLIGVQAGFRHWVLQPFILPTNGMAPTLLGSSKLLPGDYVWVNKWAYRNRRPERGDVVALNTDHIKHPQVKAGNIWIQRIVALPGETLEWTPPTCRINGKDLTEPQVLLDLMQARGLFEGLQWPPDHPIVRPLFLPGQATIVLGDDEYFVIGDNQKNSFDCRYHGPIKGDSIIGKAVYIAAPAVRKGKIH